MPKFRQTINVSYDVVVEADDMYEADKLITNMSYNEILAASTGRPYVDTDTSEFPEEY